MIVFTVVEIASIAKESNRISEVARYRNYVAENKPFYSLSDYYFLIEYIDKHINNLLSKNTQ